MNERWVEPPAAPQRWLARALSMDPSGSAILGDLLEDFYALANREGSAEARGWYWRQATALIASALYQRVQSRITGAVPKTSEVGTMIEAITPRGLIQDAAYAFNAVRKDLGLVVFATLIIGIGVGATTAVFSVMSPLLVKPLPFEDESRLVWIANDGDGGRSAVTSRSSNLRDFRKLATSFEGLTGYDAFFEQRSYTLLGDGAPERLAGVGVAHNFLDVLGIEPFKGRSFTEQEGALWNHSTIILSHALWRQRFAADENIVGQSITLNGAPSTVIGVLPSSFDFSSTFTPNSRVDLLTTFPINDDSDQWGNTLAMIGRLAPDATVANAQAELETVIENLEQAEPDRWGLGAVVTPIRQQISGSHRQALLLLFGASAAVMLIVCVNLSSLLLSKGLNRRKEMFLRSALGAPRGRLLRQMLIESLLLASAGALVGVGLATFITRSIASSTAITIPLLSGARVDGQALLFTCLVALVSGLAVGMLPAFQASMAGGSTALRGAGRTSSTGKRSRWLRETLVITEVALACALLVVGGLLLQSFTKVLDVDLGFEPSETAAWLISTDRNFDDDQARINFYQEIQETVSAVPGVTAVAMTDAIPLGINRQWGIGVPGRIYDDGETPSFYPHIVDRNYLETMGIPILSGRNFSTADLLDTQRVTIINESAAKELFPGESAVGQALNTGDEVRIIGVVADVRHVGAEKESGKELYLPISQSGNFNTLDLVVRSDLPLEAIQGPVAAAIRSIDPNMPTNDVRALDAVVGRSTSPRRFTLWLLAAFAATALLLAALGIYGVLSYTVSERTHEIGIRMALGESNSSIRRRVLGRTLLLAGAGVAASAALSFGVSKVIGSLLFGIDAQDPATFGAVAVLLLTVAALAGLVPAWRASKTSASIALRGS